MTIEGRDSAVGIVTCYRLDGPGFKSWWGVRFSTPVQTGPGAHPASYTVGIRSFLGVKQPGCCVDYPPPSSAGVKERVELYLYSPLWAFMPCARVNFTFTIKIWPLCTVLPPRVVRSWVTLPAILKISIPSFGHLTEFCVGSYFLSCLQEFCLLHVLSLLLSVYRWLQLQ